MVPPMHSEHVLQRLQQLEDIIVVLLARRKTLLANHRALNAFRDASAAVGTPLSDESDGSPSKWSDDGTAAGAPAGASRGAPRASPGARSPSSAALYVVDTKIIGQFVLAQRFVERLPLGSTLVPPDWLSGLRRVILQNAVSIPSSMLVRVLSPTSQIAQMRQIESASQQPTPSALAARKLHARSASAVVLPSATSPLLLAAAAPTLKLSPVIFSTVTGSSRERLNSLGHDELCAVEMLAATSSMLSPAAR